MAGWTAALKSLRNPPDLAIDLQGLMKSAVLARAPARAGRGFHLAPARKTARPFYSDAHDAEGGHVIGRTSGSCAPSASRTTEIRFPLADVLSPSLADLPRRIPPDRPFALINPGAAWPNKRWPPERFGELAMFLRDECGLTPVVLWGPGEENLADAVVAASANAAIAAPPTRVADIVALARAAALFVSGDTGPLHIATAVGTPTVSLFGPTDPDRNGAFAAEDVAVSRYDACGCHYDRRCDETPWCLGGVGLAEVCAAVQRRLLTARGPSSNSRSFRLDAEDPS